jgi:hypothetical protein
VHATLTKILEDEPNSVRHSIAGETVHATLTKILEDEPNSVRHGCLEPLRNGGCGGCDEEVSETKRRRA